jgi:uncharacterized protein YceK
MNPCCQPTGPAFYTFTHRINSNYIFMNSPDRRFVIILSALLGLAGCSTNSMTVSSYDGATGKAETRYYSKYYDAGDWATKGEIGISVVIDHDKTTVPVLHGLQQSMGALGPGDLEANGKVTIYLWNTTAENREIALRKFTSRPDIIELKGAVNVLPPKSRTGGLIGTIPISNYGTEIPVEVEYAVNGKIETLSLTLARRTYDDLKKYFGPEGTPPYPWSVRNTPAAR